MTLFEFSLLNDDQKADVVWKGNFMTYREETQYTIMLYKVHDFYVEVYYNNQNNTRIKFHSFSSGKRSEHSFSFSLN